MDHNRTKYQRQKVWIEHDQYKTPKPRPTPRSWIPVTLWDRLAGVMADDRRLARLRPSEAAEMVEWAKAHREGGSFDQSTTGVIAFRLDVMEGKRPNKRSGKGPGLLERLQALDPTDPLLDRLDSDVRDLLLRLMHTKRWTPQEQGKANAALNRLDEMRRSEPVAPRADDPPTDSLSAPLSGHESGHMGDQCR